MRRLLLLRGVNVGGHRKLPSKTLRALLEELGLREVPELDALVAGAGDRVLSFHTPDGLGRAKRTPDKLERKLKVAITARNWRSVLALQALLRQGS